MNVYVESNFVLEQALEQEESNSCAEILSLASHRQLRLVIPAFSLAEPHQALSGKAKMRSRLGDDLQRHLRELGRSKRHHDIPGKFEFLAAALIESAQFEREGLRRAVAEILQIAEIIPLEATNLRAAAELEIAFDLTGQDAIVLASVFEHLEANAPAESCFLNRNSKDFDDPDIRERLEGMRCKFQNLLRRLPTLSPGYLKL